MIRRFLLRLLFVLMPIAILVAGVNYFIDPANLYSSRPYVANIASLMSAGRNVDNISNYDERLLQFEVVKRLTDKPDIVVLGSSRIMEIGAAFFPDKTVKNLGVSHANIFDIIAIVGLLDSLGKLPSEIYLNVDPGLFETEATSEWMSLEPFYNYMARKNGVGQPTEDAVSFASLKKDLTLFSFEYFQQAIQFKWKGGTKKVYDAGKNTPASYGRFADGTIAYPDSYTRPDTTIVAKIAVSQVEEKKSYELDFEKEKQFLSLLQFFKKKTINLHFVMIPYHDNYYQAMEKNFGAVFSQYESRFRTIADTNNIQVIGSFSGKRYNLSQAFFYDSFHCSLLGIQKIFKSQ